MLSEEEGESLHASVNSELRGFYSLCDPTKKFSNILKRHEIRSKASKSLFARMLELSPALGQVFLR